MSGWTAADLGDLRGRTAVVTGANSGLALVTARELARAGATVVLACRNAAKGHEAVSAVSAVAGGAAPRLESLDLASLSSVREFAERVGGSLSSLDLLVNNAGVMAPPGGRPSTASRASSEPTTWGISPSPGGYWGFWGRRRIRAW